MYKRIGRTALRLMGQSSTLSPRMKETMLKTIRLMIAESWRGQRPLYKVFWLYYVAGAFVVVGTFLLFIQFAGLFPRFNCSRVDFRCARRPSHLEGVGIVFHLALCAKQFRVDLQISCKSICRVFHSDRTAIVD